MLHPRNKVVSALLYAAYGVAGIHGVVVATHPPISLVPIVGDLNILWGITAVIGAIVGIFGYSRGRTGRLLEASGMSLMAWAFTTYAAAASSALLSNGDPSSRGTQITALASLVFFCWGRAVSLFVMWRRDVKQYKALERAVSTINGND